MKRTLALSLAAIMLAAALVSCAGVHTARSATAAICANIRVTSSDGEDAAAWLTERLGSALTDRVVIGTDADGYGVDVSALEDDGYVVRNLGGEVAIFARTKDGLDRAVRRYAKAIENGEQITDVTYHEGYRVKRLTIAGNGISEYAIVRVSADDPCVTTAASTLAEYIEKACGAELPVCTEAEFAASGRARAIAISSGDETLGDEGFRITVGEDGALAIEGGVWRGALYGVVGLLEDIGWRFLASSSYGDGFIPADKQEYLYEAQRVDLTDEINRTEIPSIPIRGGVGGWGQRSTYHGLGRDEYGGHGYAIRSCHGLQNNQDIIFSGEYEGLFKGAYAEGKQPCFTDEDILKAIDAYALDYVQTRLDAGQQIGRELVAVDVAQWDTEPDYFCKCKNCRKVEREEGDSGFSHTGPMLRMANRVCALLDERYPGMCASILAYKGTDRPPTKTRPAHNLYVAFCFYVLPKVYVTCSNHCISGEDCDNSYISNRILAQYYEEWLEVTDPLMMQVWYYHFPNENVAYNPPIYTNHLDDMKYLASKGTGHVYLCIGTWEENNGLINETLSRYLCSKFAWDASITRERSLEIMREWFDLVYGDAGDLLYELTMTSERAGDLAGCWCVFSTLYAERFDSGYVSKHAEYIWDACDRAVRMARDSAEEALIEKYIAGFMYMTLVARYDEMYVNGNEADKAFIAEKYRQTWELFTKYRLATYSNMIDFCYAPDVFDPDVDPREWTKIR